MRSRSLPRAVAVAGVELGGCPLASAVSLTTFRRGDAKDALYVRKAAKDHGSQRLVEGNTHLHPDAPVVVLEDVVTTGGSTLRAIETLSAAGCRVVGVIALVDRLEGGAEAIRATGVSAPCTVHARGLPARPRSRARGPGGRHRYARPRRARPIAR